MHNNVESLDLTKYDEYLLFFQLLIIIIRNVKPERFGLDLAPIFVFFNLHPHPP